MRPPIALAALAAALLLAPPAWAATTPVGAGATDLHLAGDDVVWREGGPPGDVRIFRAAPGGPAQQIADSDVAACRGVASLTATAGAVALRRWSDTPQPGGCSDGPVEVVVSKDGGPFQVLESGSNGSSGCESTSSGAGPGTAGPVVAVARPVCAAGAIALHDVAAGTTQVFNWSDPAHIAINDIRVAGPYVGFEVDSCCGGSSIVVVLDRRTETEVYRVSLGALGEPYGRGSLRLQSDGTTVLAAGLVSSPAEHGYRLAWSSPSSTTLQFFGSAMERAIFDLAASRVATLREIELDYTLLDLPSGAAAPFAWLRDTPGANGVAWDGRRVAWIAEGAIHNELHPHDPGPKPVDEPTGWGAGPQRRLTIQPEPVAPAAFLHALVADTSTGRGLAAWARGGPAPSLRARATDPTGKPIGPERVVARGPVGALALAHGRRGDLVAWATRAEVGEIRVRSLDTAGRPKKPARVALKAASVLSGLALAAGGDGRGLIAFGSATTASGPRSLRTIAVDRNGKPGKPRRVPAPSGADRAGVRMTLAPLTGGGYVLVEEWGDSAGHELWTRRLDARGRPRGAARRLSAPGGASEQLPVVAAGPKGFLVAWCLVRGLGNVDIVVRRLDATGRPTGTAGTAVSGLPDLSAPALAGGPRAWLLAWSDPQPSDREVRAVRLDRAGAATGTRARVSHMGADFPSSAAFPFRAVEPVLATGKDGSVLAGWRGRDRGDALDGQLYVRSLAAGLG